MAILYNVNGDRFQSSRPVRDATIEYGRIEGPTTVSILASRERRDYLVKTFISAIIVSILASRERRDLGRVEHLQRIDGFNPRVP